MPQQTLDEETIIAEASDGARLVLYRDLTAEASPEDYDEDERLIINWDEIDHAAGGVRFEHSDPDPDLDGETYDMEFDKFREARLAFGLWIRCGPFDHPEGNAVPYSVATDGQDAITAFIHLNGGFPLERSATASICGVVEQTVSDRLSRVRWKPTEKERKED